MSANPNNTLQNILAKKSLILVVVVVLAFFILGIVLWGSFSSKTAAYQSQIQQKKQKNIVIEERGNVKKQLSDYVAALPKPLTSDALTNKIADYALQHNVEIIEINAGDIKKFDYYIVTPILLTVKIKDFKDLVSFMNMLETGKYPFKIEKWKGTMDESDAEATSYEFNLTSVQVKK